MTAWRCAYPESPGPVRPGGLGPVCQEALALPSAPALRRHSTAGSWHPGWQWPPMRSAAAVAPYRTLHPHLTGAPAGCAMNWTAPRAAAHRGASSYRPRRRLAGAKAPAPWDRLADLAMPLTCPWPLARAALPAPAQPARAQRLRRPVSAAGMPPAAQAVSAGPAQPALRALHPARDAPAAACCSHRPCGQTPRGTQTG